MAKDPNQLDLTIIAVVALVSIVGLLALVLNAKTTTSSMGRAHAFVDEDGNIVGQGSWGFQMEPMIPFGGPAGGSARKCCKGSNEFCTYAGTKNACVGQSGCSWKC